jgi:hypothetical protein
VPVSGTVAINNFPATQPVSGSVSVTNLPATQPISGSVDISNFPATQPISGSVDISNFPATQPISGSVTINNLPLTQPVSGQVAASGETSTIYNGTTALTPQFVSINISAAGSTVLVAGTSGKRIRVLDVTLIANAAVNVAFQTSTGPTNIAGIYYLAANGGFSTGYSPVGQFQTNVGDSLEVNLSSAVAVGGHLVYVLV